MDTRFLGHVLLRTQSLYQTHITDFTPAENTEILLGFGSAPH
jgi:hypothetical protein